MSCLSLNVSKIMFDSQTHPSQNRAIAIFQVMETNQDFAACPGSAGDLNTRLQSGPSIRPEAARSKDTSSTSLDDRLVLFHFRGVWLAVFLRAFRACAWRDKMQSRASRP